MSSAQPIGYFVHHQGRGHAERAAAIANSLADARPVTLFCAKDDIFPALANSVTVQRIPSLFEASGAEAPAMAALPMPATVHCAPLGWPGITRAFATIAQWFAAERPALFVTDVSAELGQLARLCSIPHVAVLQHGDRSDPGHMAAYDSAVGLLAPYAQTLEQTERPTAHRGKTFYAPGVGVDLTAFPAKKAARAKLGLSDEAEIVLVLAGGGGEGTPNTPLTLGARAEPESRWITIGTVRREWHETEPGNLEHRGWVDNPHDWIAAADRIVSSCGNTTVHMVLAAGKPWVVVPEWRYFDEQLKKAEVLGRERLAAVAPHWPSHEAAWRALWQEANTLDTARQQAQVDADAASKAAAWLDELAMRLWAGTPAKPALEIVV